MRRERCNVARSLGRANRWLGDVDGAVAAFAIGLAAHKQLGCPPDVDLLKMLAERADLFLAVNRLSHARADVREMNAAVEQRRTVRPFS